MAQRIRNMTEGSPVKLLISFALPLMVGNVFQQLYTVVDTAVVGQVVGVQALAALGAADWLNWLVLSVVQGLAQGFSILMAQYFGAKDYRQLSRSVGVSVTLCGIGAVVMLAVSQLAAHPVLRLLNTPDDIIGNSILYLRIIFSGIPIVAAYNLLASILRALGDSKTPLYAVIVATVVNIVLDLLFVMGLHWGIAGAAGATLIAQAVSTVYCYQNVRRLTIIQLEKSDFWPQREMTATLLKLGSPVALQNAIISAGGMVVQSVVNRYGMLFIAGFTATNKLYGLLEIAATSYGYAVTSFVGQNLGARLIKRIKQGMRAAAIIALITAAVIAVAMLLLGKGFLGLFISGTPEEVEASMAIAYHYLAVMSLCLPILYMLHIYRSALMGLGDTVVPMASGFVEMVMRVGIALLLPLVLEQEGIFYAEVGAWTGAAVLLVSAYYIRVKRL
ncbi:MATE family efflux transporter [Acutalibacter intestini]|uniref:MATE family efflux transporter n=1 Tax=Acutalibacter intestini TaxID=3093659 RepID=UPI002AC93A0D|nr:MATE family efflux transporter [Acutalibacter sp. M00204]